MPHETFDVRLSVIGHGNIRGIGLTPGFFWCFAEQHHVGVASTISQGCHYLTATPSYLLRFAEAVRLHYEW